MRSFKTETYVGLFVLTGFLIFIWGTTQITNLGDDGGVWKLTIDGQISPYLMEVDGQKLTSVNFIRLDRLQRVSISITTRKMPRELAFRREVADGYIVLSDPKGARIVADHLAFTNELILDPSGQWLYVNETMGRCLTRFRVTTDGALGDRKIVAEFGDGIFPDGLAYDAEGGLWITSVVSNRVIRLHADGSRNIVVDDSDPETVKDIEKKFVGNRFGRQEIDIGSRR